LYFIAELKSGSSNSAKETKDNVGVVVADESSYGYVSTKRVPLSSLDRAQTPRGSIIPENCFETKVKKEDIHKTILKTTFIFVFVFFCRMCRLLTTTIQIRIR
jgi:hypothetical protein